LLLLFEHAAAWRGGRCPHEKENGCDYAEAETATDKQHPLWDLERDIDVHWVLLKCDVDLEIEQPHERCERKGKGRALIKALAEHFEFFSHSKLLLFGVEFVHGAQARDNAICEYRLTCDIIILRLTTQKPSVLRSCRNGIDQPVCRFDSSGHLLR
jgi:hypothetical protein